ncbi:lytic murein transglycosylase [Aliiruegeria sabulilitoris]|uniref:lytic murein transglycosylase n=1 Tax=Aliiruegeria sabulilitoris TaxID=1510458 RepID=UPI00082A950A|nr:lytic murein transglycosylase [Aliiruegeria sabulilitoris]NDR59248.1 lytic murein transglycosylase [Pseudoruegeria sp. M32A2M]
MKRILASLLLAQMATAAVAEIPCGGSFADFTNAMKAEAISRGHAPADVDAFFRGTAQDPKVLRADRAQGIFQLPFIDFSRRVISQNRIQNGQANLRKHAATFDRVRQEYGVSPGVLLAFWALETDYGAVQGDFNTLNALLTLSHDCRRPELFQPQVYAALELFERGDFDPATTTGAWAGEIGMVQMLPRDILENGVDGDGDGKVTLKTSVPDALLSGGAMLRALGWRPNEPWMQEVRVPGGLDWSRTGLDHPLPASEWAALGVTPRSGALAAPDLPASLLLPQGRNGPAFLAYPNFNIYFEWNQSFTYVLTAAYFATRLEGAPVYEAGNPAPALSGEQIQSLQRKLEARGYDVGGIDGILGARTREAVQAEQVRLGLPADAWPTSELLNAL